MNTGVANVMACCAVGLAAGMLTQARAGIVDPAITITAASAEGTATLEIMVSQGTWSGGDWSFSAAGDIELRDPGTGARIALLRNLSCEILADPSVGVNFTGIAGPVETMFSFSSGYLTYAPITDSLGTVSAGVSVTDNDADGAVFTGLFAGDAMRALYDEDLVFDTLIAGFTVPVDDTRTMDERSPASGYTPLGTTERVAIEWEFLLSANDQASGTSRFLIIAEPGTFGLMILAGVIAVRRRR